MVYLALAAVGVSISVLALFWPQVKAAHGQAQDSADWVNRLFVLAGQADASGRQSVATAARALISALVSETPGKV